MQVVGVQLDIAWEDKAANYERVRSLLTDVHIEPGALIVLPELFATGFSSNVADIAESPGGPTDQFLADLARQYGAHVIGGIVMPDPSGKGRNELAVFGPDGGEIARYCKMHPMTPIGESDHYAAGDRVVTFTCGPFIAAPFICYDVRFPEIFRQAVRRGAQLLIVIANFPAVREAHWLALLAARAIENQAYVVGVNRCGNDPNYAFNGRSQIIDPRGQIMVDGGNGEQVITADPDIDALTEYRQQFPVLDDMRDDAAT